MFASGAVQGVALADGARPTAPMNATAAADAIDSDALRRIADNVTPFAGRDAAFDVRNWLM
jgi:hypothetical protein